MADDRAGTVAAWPRAFAQGNRAPAETTGIRYGDYTNDSVLATWGDPFLTAPPPAD